MRSIQGIIERYGVTHDSFIGKAYLVNSDEPIYIYGDIFNVNDGLLKTINPLTYGAPEFKYKAEELFPHPYYTDRNIEGFKTIKEFPHFQIGVLYLIQSGGTYGDFVKPNSTYNQYTVTDCYDYPEYFKPVYIEP